MDWKSLFKWIILVLVSIVLSFPLYLIAYGLILFAIGFIPPRFLPPQSLDDWRLGIVQLSTYCFVLFHLVKFGKGRFTLQNPFKRRESNK